ncbi:MAG: O-antigen ligase family protein [Alistipes sp.]
MLALSVPFILYFALSGRRRMRYAVGVVCAIVVGAIVLSGSRTGILAVAATGLLYAVRRRSDFLRRTTAWKKIVLAATAVSVAAGLYFIKKESADGRLLIGRCTWEMIREKPLTGHGYRCFEAGYMLRQARYFERNPESGFAPLADNVKHPFNEFLLLTAEFGAVALLLTALWIASLIRAYRKNPNDESHTLASGAVGAAAHCCFSYLLSYRSPGSIVALAAGGLTAQSRRSCERFRARRASESSPRCRPPRCWDLQRKKCITKTDGTACRKPHRPIARRCRNTSDCTRFWIKTLISSTITQRN